ncbi:MAG: DUF3372 domain-containing protein [Vitreoscilla sp.]|nr:DUF3372 domain-containing protein [Vitreoscilla sp.]MBP6674144.1 DUF3372 domain-containing protein [Vitreoscilla sp.]
MAGHNKGWGRWLARGGVAWGALLVVAWAHAAGTGPHTALAACQAPGHQTLLQAETGAVARHAQAHWLDRQRLQWPGVQAEAGTRFRLLHSAQGRLRTVPGEPAAGMDGALALGVDETAWPAALAARFAHLAPGARLALNPSPSTPPARWLQGQLALVQEDAAGRVLRATGLQTPGVLDDLYATAGSLAALGATPGRAGTHWQLWAPTASRVQLCLYADASGPALQALPLQRNATTGAWHARVPRDASGQFYSYLVDVYVPGLGRVRNRVTDPYSLGLSTDSKRSYITRLDAPAVSPEGWAADAAPPTVQRATDMVVYELHVRDFSGTDESVPAAHRGKYLAFSGAQSNGMRHLQALAQAGLTDVHLLPVFDFGSVPEAGCAQPQPQGPPDGESQQAAVQAVKEQDCFNWGYDPVHYTAPEGSFASNPADGAGRLREFRQMVMGLHRAGLRVGMDVVYNHTYASGQHEKSVLDRIVPGYYHRLNAEGVVERSTCCDNTATEHMMMGKLLIDSVLTWARGHHIDSFRFDLMGHQPRPLMVLLSARLKAELGREVPLIGEGWNFGEVADGRRFVQASQLSLNGSGIATFSDRGRDAVRGGSAGDSGAAMLARQGYVSGLHYDPNASAAPTTRDDLMRTADMVRVGLAGTLRSYVLQTWQGENKRLEQIDYAGQPAGYASQPSEVVNYVENHDNQTLFDNHAMKLPLATSREDRARAQVLAGAITAFSQGVAYFHAGVDTLRSKSLDRNSFNSGDWFNRLDWRYQTNHFGTGLPPQEDNGKDWPLMRPLLANPDIAPTPADIVWASDAFRDLLRIRASSVLFRLPDAAAVNQRLRFLNTGPQQKPTVLVGHLDGRGLTESGFGEIVYAINVDRQPHSLVLGGLKGRAWALHPVHLAPGAADPRARQAGLDGVTGAITVPARTAVVFVVAR